MNEIANNEVKVKKESFFSKLFNNIKVSRAISKEEKEVKKIQSAIIDQYKLMGEKVYNYYIQGADVGKEFEGYCAGIKSNVSNIVEHGNKINELKKRKK